MNRSILARGLALLVATSTLGCGPGNGLNLARVSGSVKYKGQPVTNGTVFFMPDEGKGTVGPPGVGSLTNDGSYILSTEVAGDGVIVGDHKIGITGVEPVAGDEVEEHDPEKDAGGYMQAKFKAAKAARAPSKKAQDYFTDKGGKKFRYVVPMKFSRPEESGISVKVDGSRTFNFDIDESGKVSITP